MTLALAAIAGVIGWQIWEANRAIGDKVRVGDRVTISVSAIATTVSLPLGLPIDGAIVATVTAASGERLTGVVESLSFAPIEFHRTAVLRLSRDGREIT